MDKLIKYRWCLLLIPVLIIGIWLFPKSCSHSIKPTPPNHDSVYKKENRLNKIISKVINERFLLKRKNDSLMTRKPIYVDRYKCKFDSLYNNPRIDTSCQNSLIMLYNSFGNLNDLNDSIIANKIRKESQDSILIDALFSKIKTKQMHRVIDSTYICDSVPVKINQAYKKGLKKGRKQGFITGVVLTESANVGSKLIKP